MEDEVTERKRKQNVKSIRDKTILHVFNLSSAKPWRCLE
jgi:hypothetical protein